MELNQNMCEMFADLEYCIGSNCTNVHTYNFDLDISGIDYRYPISLPVIGYNSEYELKVITRRSINDNSPYDPFGHSERNPKSLKYMRYRFGSNELYIGLGLKKVLDYLEKRYDLDFNALEDQYQNK